MTYKYFFGSDNRSIPYLNTLIENYDSIKVVTTEPRNTGRRRKILNNPVDDYLKSNNVEYTYFSNSNIL
jgi:Methionyl-tRNA formyltransferase